MGKLTVVKVNAIKEPGRYSDGNGLSLVVGPKGSKSWIARIQTAGRRRDIGLGSCKDVSLKEARDAVIVTRRQLLDGIDPVAARRNTGIAITTFREAAQAYIAENEATWRNLKHAAQWTSTLSTYVYPTIGNIPVARITPQIVRETVLPIWLSTPETARRVLQRIGSVLDWACAQGIRETGSATVAVRKSLPRQPIGVEHHKAIPHAELPDFMKWLCNAPLSTGRLALRCLILTGVRSGEVRGARWDELDLKAGLWTIPGERMKAGRIHKVPLSDFAVRAFHLASVLRRDDSDLVFPGVKPGKTLSENTLTKLLRDAGRDETAHGFRSSLRDWAAECTDHPNEVAKAALAHTVENKVEAAYRRTDFFDKRRVLMQDWADHCFSFLPS